MLPENYFIYVQLLLFLFITPGPSRAVIVSNTINYGLKKSVWTAFADIGYVLVSGQTAIAGKGDDLLKNPDVRRLFLGG